MAGEIIRQYLERRQRVLPAAEEAKKLDDLEARCSALAREFSAHKPSTEIEKRVTDLAEAARGTLLADAAAALKLRLKIYRSFFEESEEGRRLAQILGKPAPDFTLEDLQRKRVKFREAIAGKVTLLSFWGYG